MANQSVSDVPEPRRHVWLHSKHGRGINLVLGAAMLATALTFGFVGDAVADNVFAVGPAGISTYTDLYKLDTSGHIQQYGPVGFSVGGGLAPLTTGLTAIAFSNGNLFAIGPAGISTYTNLYQLDTSGHILQYGPVGFDLGGGLAPLTTGLTSIAFDNGKLFAVGPAGISTYTDLYQLDTSGHIQQYGPVGFSVGGGLAPLTTGLNSIAFDNGNLFAAGPAGISTYTDLYQLDTSGHVQQYGPVGFSVGGGLAPLATGLDAIAFNAVPEPSTWAMLLIGFAGLGFLGYRRNKAGSVGA